MIASHSKGLLGACMMLALQPTCPAQELCSAWMFVLAATSALEANAAVSSSDAAFSGRYMAGIIASKFATGMRRGVVLVSRVQRMCSKWCKVSAVK